MNQIESLHQKATALAELAYAAKRAGNDDDAHQHLLAALHAEKQAAEMAADVPGSEPSSASLFRSAAKYALHVGRLGESEALVRRVLKGTPPGEITQELMDILEEIRGLRATDSQRELREQHLDTLRGARTLTLPPISERTADVTVVRVRAHPGDFIQRGQTYIEMDVEKINLDIPAPYDMAILEVHVQEKDKVQPGDRLATIQPRDRLDLCELREKRLHLICGINYLSTRSAQELCYRPDLGEYTFGDLEPFASKVITLARMISREHIDAMDEAAVIELRDSLYHTTLILSKIECFDVKALQKRVEHSHIVQMVSEFQEGLLRRLIRVAAEVTGKGLNPTVELQQACAVFNPGKSYIFISHHHTDNELAQDLSRRMHEARISHFFDLTGKRWGRRIPDTIHTALRRASHIIVIMTPGGVNSPWVSYEVGFANGAEKIIVPFLQHPEMELPLFMSDLPQLRSLHDLDAFLEELQYFKRTPSRSPLV